MHRPLFIAMTPQQCDLFESLASALPSFATAAWILWRYSGSTEEETRALWDALFLLEFLALHSGAFMGIFAAKCRTWRGRAISFAILLLMYALFVVIAAVGWKAWDLLYAYGALMAGRFISLVLDAGIGNKSRMIFRSAVGFILMLVVIAGFALLTGMSAHSPDPGARVVAWSIYFFGMGVFELFALRLHEKARPWRAM